MGDRGVEHVDVLVLPLGREIAPRPSAAIDDVGRARLRLEWGEPRQRLRGEPLLPLVLAQIKPRGRQRLVIGLAGSFRVGRAARGIVVGDERDALVRRLLAARVEHERRIADIVEDRVQLVVEERQPMFDADGAAAFADRVVEVVAGGGAPNSAA